MTTPTASEAAVVELRGARVLLTGASAGIGAALAPMLVDAGATVTLWGRDRAKLDAVASRCAASTPETVRTRVVDLADPAAAEQAVLDDDAEVGGLDVLINNAGAPMRRRAQRLAVEELQRTMATNFESPARMTMAVLPGMLERDRGVIVNVSSFGGRAGIPAEAAYCASKFALCGWSESLAMDLWHSGVDVRLIVPGAIDTDIWDRPGNDDAHFSGDLEPPETVAAGIVAAITGSGEAAGRFEHYLPDLHAVAEFKTSSIDDFLAGAVAFADDADGSATKGAPPTRDVDDQPENRRHPR